MNNKWLKDYFDLYKKPLFDEAVFEQLLEFKQHLESVHDSIV